MLYMYLGGYHITQDFGGRFLQIAAQKHFNIGGLAALHSKSALLADITFVGWLPTKGFYCAPKFWVCASYVHAFLTPDS